MTSAQTPSTVVLAHAVAEATLACPGVAGLRAGRFGEVATYLPGRRIQGVRVRPDEVTVHVAVLFGHPVQEVAARLRAVVREIVGDIPVQIGIDDVTADRDPR